MGVYQKGKDFYIDYYANRRRKREKIGPSKALAKKVLQKRKIEIAENKFLDVQQQEKIRFEDFARLWHDRHSKVNKKPSSAKRDVSLLKNLCAFFAGKYLYEIDPLLIEKYKSTRIEEVKPATVNREIACLKCMFNKAIQWGKIKANPARQVKLLRENNCRVRYLEKEEIQKLLNNCPSHLRPIVTVALHTGMRRGEILNLKWQDIDVHRRIIHLYDTKNGEKREVYMNETVKLALIKVRKHPDSPYIFCKADGTPYSNVRKSFFTALKKSGIVDFKFHDLRHTFCSQLVMSGVDINTVRELVGHKSIEMTLRYSHLSPTYKRRAVDILARRLDTIWTPMPVAAKLEEKQVFAIH